MQLIIRCFASSLTGLLTPLPRADEFAAGFRNRNVCCRLSGADGGRSGTRV